MIHSRLYTPTTTKTRARKQMYNRRKDAVQISLTFVATPHQVLTLTVGPYEEDVRVIVFRSGHSAVRP